LGTLTLARVRPQRKKFSCSNSKGQAAALGHPTRNRRVTSWLNLIKLFQLPATPVTSEDDKKRTKPHLAFSSLNRCNVLPATAAAIARGKRDLEPVLPSHHPSTENGGRGFQPALLIERSIFTYGESQSTPRKLAELLTRLVCYSELK